VKHCPTPEQFRQFLAGELSRAEADEVESHVEDCPACEQRLARLTAGPDFGRATSGSAGESSDLDFLRRLAEQPPSGLDADSESARGTAVSSPTPPHLPAGPLLAPPPTFPGYEVLGELGRGGMGVVYKALHLALKRRVALKRILPRHGDDPEQVARFRREAEAAARLQHPHIVQIHEIGESDGSLYLALEFVDGGSLNRHLGGTPQPVAEAAALVETLAQAMHYAHQHGVVHRDLKPANVLRAADGNVKIADFGLAKLQAKEDAGQTRSGDILGTPSYMAPEQAEGRKAVGPLADVYALGGILYELLTGRPPFKAESTLETLEQVRRLDPVPVRRLRPNVPHDLETICLKCLRKEPGQRYASALDLADDLARFRSGRPIRARPTGRLERLVRWGRRNPVTAGLTAALLAVFAGGFTAITVLWLIATSQRAVADEQRRRAEEGFQQAREAVDECFARASQDPLFQGEALRPARKRLLEATLKYYRSFLAQRGDDPAVREETARTCYRVGVIYALTGNHEEAFAALDRARALQEMLVAADTDALPPRAELARTLKWLEKVQASTYRGWEAWETTLRACALLEALVAADPADTQFQIELANVYHVRGNHQMFATQWQEARQSYERERALWEALAAREPTDPTIQDGLALAYNGLALWDSAQRRPSEALARHERALAVREALVRQHPEAPQYQNSLGVTCYNLGHLHYHQNRYAEALRAYQRAWALFDRLATLFPTIAHYQNYLARTCNNLAEVYEKTGQVDEALRMIRQACQIHARQAAANPTVLGYQEEVARSQSLLGSLLLDQGAASYPEALRSFEQARTILEALTARDPTRVDWQADLATAYQNLGTVHQKANRTAEALPFYERARTVAEVLVEKAPQRTDLHDRLGQTCNNLGSVLADLKRYPEALAALQAAVDHHRQAATQDPATAAYRQLLGDHYRLLAVVHARCGQAAEAVSAGRQCLALWNNPAQLVDLACAFATLASGVGKGRADPRAGDPAEQRRYADFALEVLRDAVQAGFKDLDRLKKDPALDSLRQRSDFRQLLESAEKKQSRATR
jgi:tetratricopeptide (TPR) repeat protein